MKFWFGNPSWGWRLWGVSHGDKWFIGLSVKRRSNHDRLFHQKTTNSSSITHDNNCCCGCLSNGQSPDNCPYCKRSSEIESLRAEVEHVRAVLREQRQRDEALLRQALDVLERGMRNPMFGRGVTAAIRERLHDKLSTYREVARAAIAKVELEGNVAQPHRRPAQATGRGS